MKKTLLFITALILVLSFSVSAQKNKDFKLVTNLDSISYLIGADIGHNLVNNSIQFTPELLYKGISDALKNTDSLVVSNQKKNECLGKWQQERTKKQQDEKAKKSEGAKKAGTEFLAKNKTADGVKVTASGLQYKVVKEGSGEHPKATDKVKVHYHGTLIDGTVFDSSVQRGEPISFGLNQVIPGWTEGVQLMTPGSKYIFYIPSNLAYGDREAGKIPPGSTLIFEVELFSIEPQTEK
ncbi:MAG: FKBP-type peptidyl-prolyl cis-trans isomerase [Bacteroidetes bacterium]|nr:FKBP-type peptidyl-prolyl cis-trans isomerase [Bacteroidota bacterium]